MHAGRKVKIGVIGVGGMGRSHVLDLQNRVPQAELAAVCDINHERADLYAAEFQVPGFYDHADLLARADLDGVVIATPHYDHTPISIAALERGIHTLTEKPLAVHIADGRRMIAAYEQARQKRADLQFAIMFQQRTLGHWQKIKELLTAGVLGRLVRVTWLITDWFRTQTYYANGGWRATWSGEGGGVLLNQAPHNLDLYQWFFGMPQRVAGFVRHGKYHLIEVEDEVTGYFEHADGMVGHFITTTAESPGTNRLEIVGEFGKLVYERGRLTLWRNQVSMLEYIRTSPEMWGSVPYQVEDLAFSSEGGEHARVMNAFVHAILHGTPLIASAPEGLQGLMLGNAIMLSAWEERPVDLPLDDETYPAHLERLAANSEFQKPVQTANGPVDVSGSFGR